MNQNDQNNLNFLLSLNAEGFDLWREHISIEDVEYALELLTSHRAQLSLIAIELNDDVGDFTQAKQVIDSIRSI
jgi:cell division protein ZapA (FtsZ GTPase activity inhibitor)